MEVEEISLIINSVIAIAAIGTLVYQRIYNSKSLDYTFHPIFKLHDFCPHCTKFWTPKLCESSEPNSKHFCTDDHWFDITNISTGIAFEFSCYLIHKSEARKGFSSSEFKSRIKKREAFIKDGNIQYKIPKDSIPFKYYNKSSTDSLFAIIEYKTVSYGSRYLQIIELNCLPKIELNQITDWKGAIEVSKPNVVSLKKINLWNNSDKLLKSELAKIIQE
ncbi:MAG: hypothetical protein QE487_15475 [Fluviicola sp.]|nr:hypothetical protein [Fluviicola sp.]